MTTRRWIVVVALLGLEFGLIKAVATVSGRPPTELDWVLSAAFVVAVQTLFAAIIVKTKLWSVFTYSGPLTRKTDSRVTKPRSPEPN
jgi:hypothetical protein